MGKNQHSKDRLYLTRTEHASGEHRGSGKQAALRLPYKTLPYDCCAISFRPFETPLCTDDGIVFELLNIVPFLKKFRRHPGTHRLRPWPLRAARLPRLQRRPAPNTHHMPRWTLIALTVTGAPLTASDLTKLHFHRNADGQYACPVLYKPFTQHTHIVAIKKTGNVYCYDAVKQMNLKSGHLHDLLDETPFTRADVIHIQDPTNATRRELEQFSHVVSGLEVEAKDAGHVRHNDATSRIMQQVAAKAAAAADAKPPLTAATKLKAASGTAGSSSSGGGGSGGGGVKPARWVQTTGAAAASLTSTSVPVQTVNEIAPLSDEEAMRQRYAFAKAQKLKGYAQLRTSHGALNLELRVDLCPRTCDNFLTLAGRGYYNGVPFHRLIRNFMLQGGDPTGTGTGGESAWGGAFPDEISARLRHEGRGVLAMANAGPNTNRSQFYITLKSAPHLDGKHTIFGSVVGGLDTLARLESLPTDADDRPIEAVTILGVTIFVNPFEGLEEAMEAERAAKADPAAAIAAAKEKDALEDHQPWFNHERPPAPVQHRAGIGKYIAPKHLAADAPPRPPEGASAATSGGGLGASGGAAALVAASLADAAEPPPKKKARSGGGFGDFSSW